jgi:acyl carrier protein
MAISPPDIAASLETYIRREFRIIGGDEPLFRDEHLFEGGYVDSAGVVELIMFIESTFNVKFEDEHVFSEQFTTINGIAGMVAGCAAGHDAANGARTRASIR